MQRHSCQGFMGWTGLWDLSLEQAGDWSLCGWCFWRWPCFQEPIQAAGSLTWFMKMKSCSTCTARISLQSFYLDDAIFVRELPEGSVSCFLLMGNYILWCWGRKMPYGLFRTSYSHISVATSVGAKRVPLAHSTLPNIRISWSLRSTFMSTLRFGRCKTNIHWMFCTISGGP